MAVASRVAKIREGDLELPFFAIFPCYFDWIVLYIGGVKWKKVEEGEAVYFALYFIVS
jgi:hypothetical protein